MFASYQSEAAAQKQCSPLTSQRQQHKSSVHLLPVRGSSTTAVFTSYQSGSSTTAVFTYYQSEAAAQRQCSPLTSQRQQHNSSVHFLTVRGSSTTAVFASYQSEAASQQQCSPLTSQRQQHNSRVRLLPVRGSSTTAVFTSYQSEAAAQQQFSPLTSQRQQHKSSVCLLPVLVWKAGRSFLATVSASLSNGPSHGQPGSSFMSILFNSAIHLFLIIYMFHNYNCCHYNSLLLSIMFH